jgi:uncharacterized protein (DUF433 family)
VAITTEVEIGPLIYRRPDIHNGQPSLTGTGISVQNIAILHNQGTEPEEIARRKYLTLAQVHAALAYYYANKDQVDATIAEDIAQYSKLEEEWRKTRAVRGL